MQMRFNRILCSIICLVTCAGLHAAVERMEVSSRHLQEGRRAVVPVLIDAPEKVERILVDLPAGTGKNIIVVKEDKPDYGYKLRPITRVRGSLKAAGTVLVTVAAPSDYVDGFKSSWRQSPDHIKDTAAVIEALSTRFPGKPVYLAGYAEAAISLLHYAIKRDAKVAGYVLIGGYYGAMREEAVQRIAKPVLMLHARTHKCSSAPLIEARELAQRGHFRLVDVGYPNWESKPTCSATSQNALLGLDKEYAAAINQWMRDGNAPDAIGPTDVPAAYHEEILITPKKHLEVSIFRPEGVGPFPLLVFNHGDGADSVKGVRYRNFALASLFADMGFAVALPQRPGVGHSAGAYASGFSASDGDATYKAREHAKPILAAIEYLRTLPYVDGDHVVVSGQSAGGFSTMYIASTNPSWLVAAVNFSGGRNNLGAATHAFNSMMVNAFGKFGATTKVPMLWVFAEHDSRYPKSVILASHKAFEAAGGKAQLLLFPPLENGRDGHQVYQVPDLWRGQLRTYLMERGLKPGAGDIPTPEFAATKEQ